MQIMTPRSISVHLAPWLGKRGPPWTRFFKPQFENALVLQKDNFNTVSQWLNGKDFGGWHPVAPAHIAGGGALAAQNALSIQANTTRGETFMSLLKTHILNQDIVDAIVEHQTITLVGAAPRAPPQGPGGAAVAGQLPDDWGPQLWDWIEATFSHGQLATRQEDVHCTAGAPGSSGSLLYIP